MFTKNQVARQIRSHVVRELYDESQQLGLGIAIYSLADPRELRVSRYVGQTSSPQRRFLQHLNTARVWFPDEQPWWVFQPKLRPLYDWIRELYRDEGRLPTMILHEWAGTLPRARLAERARIYESLSHGLPILNCEREILGDQWPLSPAEKKAPHDAGLDANIFLEYLRKKCISD
jgi:hypothetical protein